MPSWYQIHGVNENGNEYEVFPPKENLEDAFSTQAQHEAKRWTSRDEAHQERGDDTEDYSPVTTYNIQPWGWW